MSRISQSPPNPRARSLRLALWGALVAVLSAYPIAAALVVLFRFPVPFVGYESGIASLGRAMIAVTIYGALGGFMVLAVGGGLAAALARFVAADVRFHRWVTALLAICWSGLMLGLLSVLDWIIGPW